MGKRELPNPANRCGQYEYQVVTIQTENELIWFGDIGSSNENAVPLMKFAQDGWEIIEPVRWINDLHCRAIVRRISPSYQMDHPAVVTK